MSKRLGDSERKARWPRREQYGPARLDCQGSPSCGQWVMHRFVNKRLINDAKEILYACTKCGELRVWGLESLHELSPGEIERLLKGI